MLSHTPPLALLRCRLLMRHVTEPDFTPRLLAAASATPMPRPPLFAAVNAGVAADSRQMPPPLRFLRFRRQPRHATKIFRRFLLLSPLYARYAARRQSCRHDIFLMSAAMPPCHADDA